MRSETLGAVSSTAYNEAGQRISSTDELNHTTQYFYDQAGRMIRTINPENETSGHPEFDSAGRVSAQVDPSDNSQGHRFRFVYDDAGRQVSVFDQDDHETRTVYDTAGRVTQVTQAVGELDLVTTYTYDDLGRQTLMIDPMLNRAESHYDLAGNMIRSVDAKGKSTFYSYDSLGRQFEVTDRLTHQTHYGFDRAGRQASITDAQSGVTRYGYDAFGRLAQTQYPDHVPGTSAGDSGYDMVEFQYDHHGRLERRTDQTGYSVDHIYDPAGRLAQRQSPASFGAPSIIDTLTYLPTGQIETARSQRYENTVSFDYDKAGRKIRETIRLDSGTATTFATLTTYDNQSRVSQLEYPDGTLVDREYNARGQLSEVKTDGQVIDTRTYDAANRLETSVYGNGVSTTFDYWADHRMKQVATTTPGSQGVGVYDYAYDANGNKTSEAITGAGIQDDFGFATPASNGYDALDRLTAWNRADGNADQSWNLKPVGHWNSHTVDGDVTALTHSAGHELTGFDGQAVQYDAKGNRLTSLIAGDTQPYLWDQDNRLTSAGDYRFEYDALGRRVFMSRFDSATQTFQKDALVYNDQQLIATYRLAGSAWNVTRTFVYGSYIDEPLLMESAGQQLFFNRNQQYSITALTDASGSVVERYVYDAYGETTVLSPGGTPIADSAFGNPFTYTGRFNHADLGLMYFRARYYDPNTGEFISRDPLEYVDGMSLYRGYFVPGMVDPDGELKVIPVGDTSDKTNCGKPTVAAWDFVLSDDAPCHGWIIQKVSISCDSGGQNGECSSNDTKPASYSFFEAWHVTKGRRYPDRRTNEDGTVVDHNKVPAGKTGVTDVSSISIESGTCGVFSAIGRIRFYCENPRDAAANGVGTGDLKQLWKGGIYGIGTCAAKMTGDLPSISGDDAKAKTLWASNPVEGTGFRLSAAIWNCCGDNKFARHVVIPKL